MISFKQFLLLEGGNVQIDDRGADRIDLTKHGRRTIVSKIDAGLAAINAAFKKQQGKPIWSDALFKSKQFLSGSAYHFFNGKIDDKAFSSVKSSVGDIDTQVDAKLDGALKEFLTANKGKTFGPFTLIGFKSSAGQHITLWHLDDPSLNIQIDLELVEFGADGSPTDWAQFSHSSAWADMKKGVKGVAHKFLLRALNAPHLKDVVIKAKTPRGKDREATSAEYAFSVTNGLRKKLKPVVGDDGKQVIINGRPAYHEMGTSESKGTTSLEDIFTGFFKKKPTKEDLAKMGSFTGLIELVKTHFSKADQQKIADGFGRTLWGEDAQGLYRGDAEKDAEEKNAMMKILLDELGLNDNYKADRAKFYAKYK